MAARRAAAIAARSPASPCFAANTGALRSGANLVTLTEILAFAALALLLLLIWDSLRSREAALAACRAACATEGWMFLDDTVAVTSIRPVRDDDGWIKLRRVYAFEFSDTGDRRRPGTVTLVGPKVIVIRMERDDAPMRTTWH